MHTLWKATWLPLGSSCLPTIRPDEIARNSWQNSSHPTRFFCSSIFKRDGSFLLCLLNVVFRFIRSIRNENVRLETNVLYLFIFRIVDRIDGGIVWIFRFSYCGRRKKEWRWRCKASKDCLKYMNINDSLTPQLNVPCYKETSFM